MIRSITERLQKESSMIKVLSHDIATPLTVIKAVTQMLKKKVSAEDAVSQDLIRRLGIQTKSVEQILEHVRDMKALESGKRRLDLHEIEFGVVLNEIHEAFQDRLSDKGLTLSWNKADDAVTFVADAVSFRVSVLSNLISNAIKFSTRGGRIDVSCREVNGATTIQVRDYGAGIPLSIRANLFSSNHATTRAGSEGESGTGFGMPLIKFYIDLYGGKIDFSTKLVSDSATDHNIYHPASDKTKPCEPGSRVKYRRPNLGYGTALIPTQVHCIIGKCHAHTFGEPYAARSRGSGMVNSRVVLASDASNRRDPLWSEANPCAIERPRPVPSPGSLVV